MIPAVADRVLERGRSVATGHAARAFGHDTEGPFDGLADDGEYMGLQKIDGGHIVSDQRTGSIEHDRRRGHGLEQRLCGQSVEFAQRRRVGVEGGSCGRGQTRVTGSSVL